MKVLSAEGGSEDRDGTSFVPGALPAVTVPSFLNAGFSFASASNVESERGDSSVLTITGSPFFCGISTGTIWAAKNPCFSRTCVSIFSSATICSLFRQWKSDQHAQSGHSAQYGLCIKRPSHTVLRAACARRQQDSGSDRPVKVSALTADMLCE